MTASNLNIARSEAMRQRLISAAQRLLVEVGYANTTGVAVCKAAGVTRGALNHHFPDFADLLIATLQQIYSAVAAAVEPAESNIGPMEALLLANHKRVTQPEFKAVIELWLASRNDPAVGAALRDAIVEASKLFEPHALMPEEDEIAPADTQADATFYTIMEALIGIALGRASNGGEPSAHEGQVLETLRQLARQQDSHRRRS